VHVQEVALRHHERGPCEMRIARTLKPDDDDDQEGLEDDE
jgi:hypothetical protein